MSDKQCLRMDHRGGKLCGRERGHEIPCEFTVEPFVTISDPLEFIIGKPHPPVVDEGKPYKKFQGETGWGYIGPDGIKQSGWAKESNVDFAVNALNAAYSSGWNAAMERAAEIAMEQFRDAGWNSTYRDAGIAIARAIEKESRP